VCHPVTNGDLLGAALHRLKLVVTGTVLSGGGSGRGGRSWKGVDAEAGLAETVAGHESVAVLAVRPASGAQALRSGAHAVAIGACPVPVDVRPVHRSSRPGDLTGRVTVAAGCTAPRPALPCPPSGGGCDVSAGPRCHCRRAAYYRMTWGHLSARPRRTTVVDASEQALAVRDVARFRHQAVAGVSAVAPNSPQGGPARGGPSRGRPMSSKSATLPDRVAAGSGASAPPSAEQRRVLPDRPANARNYRPVATASGLRTEGCAGNKTSGTVGGHAAVAARTCSVAIDWRSFATGLSQELVVPRRTPQVAIGEDSARWEWDFMNDSSRNRRGHCFAAEAVGPEVPGLSRVKRQSALTAPDCAARGPLTHHLGERQEQGSRVIKGARRP